MGNACTGGKKDRNYSNNHGVPSPCKFSVTNSMEQRLQKDVRNVGELKGPKRPDGPVPSMQSVQLAGSLMSDLDRLQQEWKPFDEVPKHIQIIQRVIAGTDVMSAHKESGEANEALIDELKELMCIPGNESCADCPNRDPTWASVNLGILICMKCSGIHRMMGTHISKVRAVDLDRWNAEQVQRIRDVGNVKSNEFWQLKLPPPYDNIPSESSKDGPASDLLRKFIFKKYQDREFCTNKYGASHTVPGMGGPQ